MGCSGTCFQSCTWIVGCSSWIAPGSRRSGKRRKKRREGRGKFGRRESPVKLGRGKKKRRREGKRGGKTRSRRRRHPAEHPAEQQHLKFPPTTYGGGNLNDVAAKQGLAEQKGANFLKNGIFPRQYAKMENRVCKSVPRLVFSFTRKNFEVEFSQAL